MIYKMPYFWAFGKIIPCRVENEWMYYPSNGDPHQGEYEEDGEELKDRGAILRSIYYGVCFIVPGCVIQNKVDDTMFIVKDIVHNDFSPSILPEKDSNLAQWHRKLVRMVRGWKSLGDTKKKLEIKPVNHLVLEEMKNFFFDK